MSVRACAIRLTHKACKSNRVEIEGTMKQVITLFRTRGVNPETVLVRRENKPQTVVLQCLPWIAMGTTCNNNIQRPQVNLLDKTEIESRGHRDQTCGCQDAGKGRRGSLTLADANFYMQDGQTIRSYCRGRDYIQSPEINHTGKEYQKKNIRMCTTESLVCTAQFSSGTQSCLTLCDPMDCSTPGLPVHHQLPEFTQTHVH